MAQTSWANLVLMMHEKSCGTIIINQNRVLLIGAKDNDGKMFWSFPKGHQEYGETDMKTALRETFEETGLRVQIIDPIPITTSHLINDNTGVKDIYLFLARTKDKEIKPQAGEVEEWQWVNFDEVSDFLLGYYKVAWQEAMNRTRS